MLPWCGSRSRPTESINLWNLNSHLIAEVERKPRGNLIIAKVILKGVHVCLKGTLPHTQYPFVKTKEIHVCHTYTHTSL